MALPRFFALQSKYEKNKYLRYVNDDPKVHGFNKFDGDDVVSPYARYELVQSKTADGLVHIRCCYNNKYWVLSSPNQYWLVSGANEPEEDESKWSCTLFKPSFLDDKTVRLVHVQLKVGVAMWGRNNDDYDVCLYASIYEGLPGVITVDVFEVVDLESLLVLPKRVAFKGDTGEYLRANFFDGNNYLQFSDNGNDLGDPKVLNQVFVTSDGSVRIKSDHFGKFWNRGAYWIWADADENENSAADTMFFSVKTDNIGGVALRNLGNNKFCRRFTIAEKLSCLSARDPDISQYSILNLEEPVSSRDIFGVKYHVKDARIYEKNTVVMAHGEAKNISRRCPIDMVVKLSYTAEKTSRTWNGRVFFKSNRVETAVRAGIPSVSEGNVVIVVNENPGLHKWGETEESTFSVQEIPFVIPVPWKATVKVRLLATKAWCDVPFSYTQCDTMTNGEKISDTMADGLYTGSNYFDFKYEINFIH